MESKLYSLTNIELQALIMFLDRVPCKGIQENQLFSRIVNILKNPTDPPTTP